MDILAISDAASWDWLHTVQEQLNPDVIVLAGDLLNDGKTKGNDLKEHANQFYDALATCAEMAPTLVLEGNHDPESPYYDKARIFATPNVWDISWKRHNVGGIEFAGLAYQKNIATRSRELYGDGPPVDIAVSHLPSYVSRQIPGRLSPRIVIQGHHGHGTYIEDDVPFIIPDDSTYAIINLKTDTVRATYYNVHDGQISLARQAKLNGEELPLLPLRESKGKPRKPTVVYPPPTPRVNLLD